MILEAHNTVLAVCKIEPGADIPRWATRGNFFSVTKTSEELSIVCSQENVPVDVKAEKDWCYFKVAGPLDFGLTGILASLANPLAQAEISIFAVSTFDTDYLLVKKIYFEGAIEVLRIAGHEVRFF